MSMKTSTSRTGDLSWAQPAHRERSQPRVEALRGMRVARQAIQPLDDPLCSLGEVHFIEQAFTRTSADSTVERPPA